MNNNIIIKNNNGTISIGFSEEEARCRTEVLLTEVQMWCRRIPSQDGMARTCEYFGVGRTSLKRWRKDEESLRNAEHLASKSRHRLGNGGRPTIFPSDKVHVLINFINKQREKHFKVTVQQLIVLMKSIDEDSLQVPRRSLRRWLWRILKRNDIVLRQCNHQAQGTCHDHFMEYISTP